MNIADPFKQLVERKLWPVALLLVAALVAVPVMMASEPETTALPPSTTSALPAGAAASESIVSLGDPSTREAGRPVLGARKDPFRPAQLHRVEKEKDTLTEAGTATSVDTSASAAGSSASSGTSTATTDTSGGKTTVAPAPVVELVDVQVPYVHFDLKRSGKEVEFAVVKRLQSFPSAANPVALFLGLDEKGKAVFSLDEGVEIEGDGKCAPAKDNCDALLLGNEETAFLTRGDKEYQLEVLVEDSEALPADVAEYWATEAKDGREVLKDMGAAGFRYSKTTGIVTEVERKERKAGSEATGSKLLSAG